jgi:hypothetical protein
VSRPTGIAMAMPSLIEASIFPSEAIPVTAQLRPQELQHTRSCVSIYPRTSISSLSTPKPQTISMTSPVVMVRLPVKGFRLVQ